MEIAKFFNENQGVVTVAIFLATALFGWLSGIFSALRRKPRLKIRLIDGPTMCVTFPTGRMYNDFEEHRTAIALYLQITNVGSAATSIDDINVGFHWSIKPFSLQWLRFGIGWSWINYPAIALADFQISIGDHLKSFPFLIQARSPAEGNANTYLDIGQTTNGVVYFEQKEAWGGAFPRNISGRTRLKIRVIDAFGSRHVKKAWVDVVSLEHARTYNPMFGLTFEELRSGTDHSSSSSDST